MNKSIALGFAVVFTALGWGRDGARDAVAPPARDSAFAAAQTMRTQTVEAADPRLDHDLVGTSPPEWNVTGWKNSAPLRLADLRGSVVLVRWFRGARCPLCSATAPSLRALHQELSARGLVVVGMYDDAGSENPEARFADDTARFAFEFPVARDPDLRTLHQWWLDAHRRELSSVTFLLDRRGRVRGVHQGGRWAPGDPDYAAIHRAIERLLAEPSQEKT